MKKNQMRDIEKLSETIKDELGIDIQKYRNAELAGKFIELLAFPKYISSQLIRPVSIYLGVFLFGFLIFDLAPIDYLVYGVLGFLLFLASGTLLGLLFLSGKMKTDITELLNYSLDIMNSIIMDLNTVSSQLRPEKRKDTLGLLFNGIIHIVTIPTMSEVIRDKIPFVGGYIAKLLTRTLVFISDRIKFDEGVFKPEVNSNEVKESTFETYLKSISNARLKVDKVLDTAFSLAQTPLKLGMGITHLVLILLLFIVH